MRPDRVRAPEGGSGTRAAGFSPFGRHGREGYGRRRFGALGCPLPWGVAGSHSGCPRRDRPRQPPAEPGSGAPTTSQAREQRWLLWCRYRGAYTRPEEQRRRPHVCLCSGPCRAGQVRGRERVTGLGKPSVGASVGGSGLRSPRGKQGQPRSVPGCSPLRPGGLCRSAVGQAVVARGSSCSAGRSPSPDGRGRAPAAAAGGSPGGGSPWRR